MLNIYKRYRDKLCYRVLFLYLVISRIEAIKTIAHN